MERRNQRYTPFPRFPARLLLAGILLCSTACKEEGISPEMGDTSLIPLAVGNQWHYQVDYLDTLGNIDSTTFESEGIDRDTLVGADQWYGFVTQGFRMNRPDGVWQLVPSPHLEYPVTVGDSAVQGGSGNVIRLVSKGTRVTVPGGIFVCYEYSETLPTTGTTIVQRHFLAPGLGIIRKDVFSPPQTTPTKQYGLVVYEPG